MTHARTAVALIALGSVFGSAFLFMKVLVNDVSPMSIVFIRLLLGALAVAAVVVFRRQRLSWSPTLVGQTTVLATLSLVLPYALIAWAETHIDSGIAAALISTMPLFTATYAALLYADERMSALRFAGLLAGFAGVVALSGGEFDVRDSGVLAQFAVVGAAASYGLGAAYSRVLLRSAEPLSLGSLELALGTVIALPLMFVIDGGADVTVTPGVIGALLALGVGATGAAFVGYLWLVDNAGSVRASLVTYVVPVVGLFLGWVALGEHVGWGAVVGTGLIILGVAGAMIGRAPTSEREPVPVPAEAATTA